MESILELLTLYPGPIAFVLLVACGLGLPPWSEEIVILGTGYLVAEGHLSFVAALGWCLAGLLAGDSLIYLLGSVVGERVYSWPLLRRRMGQRQRARFNRRFQQEGTKAVFIARFVPGFRLVAYFVAGNLGMPYWKFLALDVVGCALSVPLAVWIGKVFSENLDQAIQVLKGLEIPLAIAGVGILGLLLYRAGARRRQRLFALRRERAARRAKPCEAGAGGCESEAGGDSGAETEEEEEDPERPTAGRSSGLTGAEPMAAAGSTDGAAARS